MAKTFSSMLALGTSAPHFSLPDVISGQHVTLDHSQVYTASVIFFICNHCPYVKHINQGLIDLVHDYKNKNIRFIGINANDIEQYPDDAPIHMKNVAQTLQYPFPYLFDATQEVAKAYHATCTPDFFVFNEHLKLVYRGQLDDARPGNNQPVNGHSLREALNQVLLNQPVSELQKPSMGCNIKWRD